MREEVKLEWKGNAVKEIYRDAVAEALWLTGQSIVTDAMNDIPLDTGTLRRSYAVTVGDLPDGEKEYQRALSGAEPKTSRDKQSGLTATVFISYNTPYAAWLHENLNWKPREFKRMPDGRVVPKPAVGGAKWLENAMQGGGKRVNAFLKQVLKRRGDKK